MFDFVTFAKIVLWVVAAGAGIMTILTCCGNYYYHCTAKGKLELMLMQIRERSTITFKWRFPLLFLFATIALFCFN